MGDLHELVTSNHGFLGFVLDLVTLFIYHLKRIRITGIKVKKWTTGIKVKNGWTKNNENTKRKSLKNSISRNC